MKLVTPSEDYFESFQDALSEWQGEYQDGAGIRDASLLRDRVGFAEWVAQLIDEEKHPAREGFVRAIGQKEWMTSGVSPSSGPSRAKP